MPTPSIQTLVTDAQQVLNLDSISAIRSVVAVALANANVGTPLNPNLTTQQLWNEFYQVVTKPKSDIESIIANQLMKMLFAPPAPGGVGADKQVIFNDGGTLAGDPQFLWNKTTNLLTVTGSATITGDLTVDTSTLKVDSANDRVGVRTATPRSPYALDVLGSVALGDSTTTSSVRLKLDCLGTAGNVAIMSFATAGTNKAFFGLSGGYIGDASSDAIIGTDAAGAAIRFYTSDNGVEVARFNSTGNLAFPTGKGIDFSATASGSGTMTSELLNDYEEGTWSPAVSVSMGNLTSVTSVSARYTKVGRIVTLSGYVTGTVTSPNLVTYFILLGLPFTQGSTTVGTLFENSGLKIGTTQVVSNNLYAYFPVPSAITAGAKDFYYEITYTV